MPKLTGNGARRQPDPIIIYPEVMSASRATDIPAFHAAWLMDRMRAGQCEWQNPFNASQRRIVSFAKVEAIVFWSKNPAPLEPYLDEISGMGKKFYFQFTLNDYEAAGLEPGVPKLADRIATFARLAQKCKVIWRYDPVVLGGALSIGRHLRTIRSLMQKIGDCAEKLVFSFVDLYGVVRSNLKRLKPELRAPRQDEMEEFALGLAELRDAIAPGLKLASCAETGLDHAALGIEKSSCIDPVLINAMLGREICRPKQSGRLSLPACGDIPEAPVYEKDRGQRKECQCAPSKDIGGYRMHPCSHRCAYCYARHFGKSI